MKDNLVSQWNTVSLPAFTELGLLCDCNCSSELFTLQMNFSDKNSLELSHFHLKVLSRKVCDWEAIGLEFFLPSIQVAVASIGWPLKLTGWIFSDTNVVNLNLAWLALILIYAKQDSIFFFFFFFCKFLFVLRVAQQICDELFHNVQRI